MPVHLETPQTSDGKAIFIPVLFRGDLHSMYMGFGDDVTDGERFTGQQLAVSIDKTAGGETTVEWQYIDYIYLAGGIMTCKNAVVGDYANYCIGAPATAGTNNVGTGAYGKYAIGGGISMYVPAGFGGTAADWDLDLDETLNANVDFTKVVPVPAPHTLVGNEEVGTGFFDWDPDTGEVTFNADGTGHYNLFDTELKLTSFARFVLLGDTTYDMRTPSQKPKRLLPQWKSRVVIYNSTDRSSGDKLEVAWNIHYARVDAT